MVVQGKNIIGFSLSATSEDFVTSFDPREAKPLEKFYMATNEEIEETLQKASHAFGVYKHFSGSRKADFLEAIADEILALEKLIFWRQLQMKYLPLMMRLFRQP